MGSARVDDFGVWPCHFSRSSVFWLSFTWIFPCDYQLRHWGFRCFPWPCFVLPNSSHQIHMIEIGFRSLPLERNIECERVRKSGFKIARHVLLWGGGAHMHTCTHWTCPLWWWHAFFRHRSAQVQDSILCNWIEFPWICDSNLPEIPVAATCISRGIAPAMCNSTQLIAHTSQKSTWLFELNLCTLSFGFCKLVSLLAWQLWFFRNKPTLNEFLLLFSWESENRAAGHTNWKWHLVWLSCCCTEGG